MATTTIDTKKLGRRCHRFSLGVLCLLVAAIALWLGHVANEARRQRREIKRLGGIYYFDYPYIGGSPGTGSIPNAKPLGPAWLRRWIGNEPFQEVVHLHLGARCRDGDLALLKDLPQLNFLSLQATNMTDAGLAHLHARRQLRRLITLSSKNIGDAGMAQVRDLENLEVLWLVGGSRVRDAGIEKLLALKQLQEMDVDCSKTTDVALLKLAKVSVVWTDPSEAAAETLKQKMPGVEVERATGQEDDESNDWICSPM